MATFARALGAAELRHLDISSCMLGDEFAGVVVPACICAGWGWGRGSCHGRCTGEPVHKRNFVREEQDMREREFE